MRLFFVILLLANLPGTLFAQPVSVQTGEHATFSRVVVRLPADDGWTFGRNAEGYTLRLAVAEGYNLRRFYDLIPKARITSVSQDVGSGELYLAVSCACRADVTVTTSRYLVIDIAYGAADPASPFERSLDGDSRSIQTAGARPGLFPVVFPPLLQDTPFHSGLASPLPVPEPRQPLTPVVFNELDALERRVIESLGRGLTAGLLEPDGTVAPTTPAKPPVITLDLPLPGISVSTGFDSAAIPPDEGSTVAADGSACVPDSFVTLATWADERSFGEQISERWSALVQEFDRLDPDQVAELARLYLHFGFGREAIQTLALDGVGSGERMYLRMLGQIIDDDPVTFPDADRQLTCMSDIALWAFLAMPPDQGGSTGDRAAILRAFKALPSPLQRHLGPRLAERFAAIGDHDAADQALRPARRHAPEAVETRLAAATLSGRMGDESAELEELARLARSNARITADAMIRFLTESVRQGQPVSPTDITLADTLRFEHALTPVAGDIAVAQISAFLVVDAFSDATRILEEERANLGSARAADLQAAIDVAAVERMADAEFLAYALLRTFPDEGSSLREEVARRLLSLGFPDQALRTLATTTGTPSEEEIHLRASAFLMLRDPEATIRSLGDLQTDRAEELRAASRSLQAGDTAATVDAPDSDVTDWRRGNWTDLARSDDQMMRDAVAAMLTTGQNASNDSAPLTSGRALLEDAAESRALLNGLLERFVRPDEF